MEHRRQHLALGGLSRVFPCKNNLNDMIDGFHDLALGIDAQALYRILYLVALGRIPLGAADANVAARRASCAEPFVIRPATALAAST